MGLELRAAGRLQRREEGTMIRVREITILPEQGMDRIRYEAARLLKVPAGKIREITVVRRSVDARKKPEVRLSYTVDVRVDGNEKKILAHSGCRPPDCLGMGGHPGPAACPDGISPAL